MTNDSSRCPYRSEQIAQLVVDFLGAVDSLPDLGVRFAQVVTGERPLEPLEEPLLAGAGQLLAQPRQRLREQGQGPAAFEERLGRGGVGRFEVIAALAGLEIERQQRAAAAAFLGVGSFALLGQEAQKGGQQKATKLAALGV